MKPVVGITPDEGTTTARTGRPALPRYELKRSYVEAVASAGGLPLILPYTDDAADIDAYLRLVRGVVVTGGAFDVPPSEYGEEPHPKLGPLNEKRTSFERRVMTRAIELRMPVLGICGGMQLLNVIRGGTLFQDLGSQCTTASNHEQAHDPREPGHKVQIASGSRLAALCGREADVNSTHHQAIKDLGRGLFVSGASPDGIVEAIEDPNARFLIGVQWHPELLRGTASDALFAAFLAATRE